MSAPVGSIRWQLGLAGMTLLGGVIGIVWWPVPMAWDVADWVRRHR